MLFRSLNEHFAMLALAHKKMTLKEHHFRLFAHCLIKGLEDLLIEKMIPEARAALTRVCLEVGKRITQRAPLPGRRAKAA